MLVKESLLGAISYIRTGYPFKGKVHQGDDRPELKVIQPKNIFDGNISEPLDEVSMSRVSPLNKHLLAPGDLLISNKGVIFSSYLVEDHFPTVASSSLFVVQPQPNVLLPEFLYWYLSQDKALNYLRNNVSGSTIPSLTKKALEQLPIPLTPLDKQLKVAKLARVIKEEKKTLQSLITKRGQYRDSYCWELIEQK